MPNRASNGLLLAIAAVASSMLLSAPGQADTRVQAVYRLAFNGFEVGTFKFDSTFTGNQYSAQSQAKVSALFGAFKWQGEIVGNGDLIGERPRPSNYTMEFKTKSKRGKIVLGFRNGDVGKTIVRPEKKPKRDAVPILPEHYKKVFDPMGAIMAITNGMDDDPCNKRVPIFDGKARFDLRMNYLGLESVQEKNRSGQPSKLFVCRVKYQPIAGHQPKDFDDPWIKFDRIEIALRPIPSADVYVPYRVTIPTSIGPAEMTIDKVLISKTGQQRIALSQ